MKYWILLSLALLSGNMEAVEQKGTSPFKPITPTRTVVPPASKTPRSDKTPLPPIQREEKRVSTDKTEAIPGILVYKDGKWAQSDFLGHVPANIGINVEILAGGSEASLVGETLIEELVTELFRKQGISPNPMVRGDGPPLPFLNILVLIYITDQNCYSIYVAARLFEEVKIIRENFEPSGHWQAITWENQIVETVKKDQLASRIKVGVEDVVTAFLKRYLEYNPKKF